MYLHVMSIRENRRIEIIIVAKISQNYLHKQSFLKGTQSRTRNVGLIFVGEEEVRGQVGDGRVVFQLKVCVKSVVLSQRVGREEVSRTGIGRGGGGGRGRVRQDRSGSGW